MSTPSETVAATAAVGIATAHATTVSTPLPTVSVADLQPSTKLAYFHTISPDGDSPEYLAENADFIILTSGDEPYRDALRQAGYTGLILQYLNASQVNGPGPYHDVDAACDAEYEPLRNGLARSVGAFCADLHPNEDWFLHNGSGERLYSVLGGGRIWYHMNPGNPEWRAYASQAIAREVIGPNAVGFDGAFLDNVELSLTRMTEHAANADGTVREYEQDREYHDAWAGYLEQVRARVGAGIPIWASLGADPNRGLLWAPYLAHLDGVMSPAFATGYEPLIAAKWENNIAQAEAAIESGKSVVAVSQGRRDDEAWQQFALASYLLISDGEHAFFRYMSDESEQALVTLWPYPNYEVALGEPLGPRTKSGSTWRREFQCGYVEVNPTIREGSIVQTDCVSRTGP